MIIDTHIHEKKYSPDSHFNLEEAVNTAKSVGLDGICITDHDNNKIKSEALEYGKKNDFLIIVGAEILTFEGDILIFGVDELPDKMVHAEELLDIVNMHKGAAISAHPFRTNNRGLKDYIRNVKDMLSGVEVFNGSTTPHHNLYAYALATELELPLFGASDAHITEKIGTYATVFEDGIKNERDFIDCINSKNLCPAVLKNGRYEKINIFDTYK